MAAAKGVPLQDRPEKCYECEHPLRPGGTTATEFPGTRLHRGKGRCSTCATRERKRMLREGKPKRVRSGEFKNLDELGELRHYIQKRRARVNGPRATTIKIAGRRAA